MLTEDYILRMINQVIAALLKVAGLKKSGRNEEALQVIDQAYEQLLGLPPTLVKQMDDNSILMSLTSQGQLDAGQLTVLADLSRDEGDILIQMNRPDEGFSASCRALRFYLETSFAETRPDAPDAISKIDALYWKMQVQELPFEIQTALLGFYQNLLADGAKVRSVTGISQKTIKAAISNLTKH
jgi:hypothetical protein